MTKVPSRLVGLRRLLGVFLPLLMGATWPLWGQPPGIQNPHIPWTRSLCAVPFAFDGFLLGALGLAVLAMVAGRGTVKTTRLACGVAAVAFGLLLLLDQHRLQPWAWQFWLLTAICCLTPDRNALRLARWLVISIYFYSAISKVDAAFISTQGLMLLDGILRPLGIAVGNWPTATRSVLIGIIPLGELLTACLLLARKTQRIGLMLSIVMHLLLLWTLGIGLHHQPGVLLWNLYFICQNLLLFTGTRERSNSVAATGSPAEYDAAAIRNRLLGSLLATVIAGFALIAPAAEWAGWFDHWPAWAVYCARPARVRILVTEEAVNELPPSLQQYFGQPDLFETRRPFDLERWSFRNRYCPIYPQWRYRLALTSALLADEVPSSEIEVDLQFAPNRWTGARASRTLRGWEEIQQQLGTCWLNSQARRAESLHSAGSESAPRS